MPSRIQRRRSRGWRQPSNAIYVGRPTKWGNPYKVGTDHHTVEEAVMLFRKDLIAGLLPFTIDDVRRELKGKNPVCRVSAALRVTPMCCFVVANGGGAERPAVRTEDSTGGRER